MRNPPLLLTVLFCAAAVTGCAAVTTRVTLLDPAFKSAPTHSVAILFDYPPQPHARIALIEAQGAVGGSEAELLEDARSKAKALGADAIVRLEVNSVYRPPARVYDAWGEFPFYPRYTYPYRPFPLYPYAYGPFLFPPHAYRLVGGGTEQALKAVAIKYTGAESDVKVSP